MNVDHWTYHKNPLKTIEDIGPLATHTNIFIKQSLLALIHIACHSSWQKRLNKWSLSLSDHFNSHIVIPAVRKITFEHYDIVQGHLAWADEPMVQVNKGSATPSISPMLAT